MKLKEILILFIFLTLAGCSLSPRVTSYNLAPGYKKKISGLSVIYLAYKIPGYAQIKSAEFEKLSVAFTNAGIKTNLYFYSGLNLNDEENLAFLQKKNPYFLVINPVSMTTGDTVNITYNLSLYDVSINKKVWVADLWVPFGWTKNIYARYDEMSALIVEKLVASGLIDTNSPAQN